MKKRKSPFGMIAILAILLVAVVMVNARSHATEPTAQEQAAQQAAQQQGDAKAPDAAALSKQLKSEVKSTSPKPQPKPTRSVKPGSRPALVDPHAEDANPGIKPKADINSGVQGGWYNKDSALNNNK